MRPFASGFAIIFLSAASTVTVLAACGSYFTPSQPDSSNVYFWGTQCDGFFGKGHIWQIYYTDNYVWPNFAVAAEAYCDHSDNSLCYPGFDTPAWSDPPDNKHWDEVTHAPTVVHQKQTMKTLAKQMDGTGTLKLPAVTICVTAGAHILVCGTRGSADVSLIMIHPF